MKRPGYADELQEFTLLPVPVPAQKERQSLASLLQHWSAPIDDPGRREWCIHAPKVLLIQLQRFYVMSGRAIKNTSPVDLTTWIDIPLDDPELHTGRVCSYQVCSVILRSGSSPVHGHYTTICLAAAGCGLLLNDDAVPRALTKSETLRLCSGDMYVLCLVRQD